MGKANNGGVIQGRSDLLGSMLEDLGKLDELFKEARRLTERLQKCDRCIGSTCASRVSMGGGSPFGLHSPRSVPTIVARSPRIVSMLNPIQTSETR